MREGDAIAAARRRLPMVEVDGATLLVGEHGAVTLLDVFEGRRMLIAYYFMWHTGQTEANAEQWRTNGRPTAQWSRLKAGHSDDLGPAC